MEQYSVNISTRKLLPCVAAHTSLLALIAVSLAWELWTAPLREGGPRLALKVLPPCLSLSGILKGRAYTYQHSSMLVPICFVETVMRLFDATSAGCLCAAVAAVCYTVFLVSCMAFIKQKQKEARHG